jgi:hypothetical protein
METNYTKKVSKVNTRELLIQCLIYQHPCIFNKPGKTDSEIPGQTHYSKHKLPGNLFPVCFTKL